MCLGTNQETQIDLRRPRLLLSGGYIIPVVEKSLCASELVFNIYLDLTQLLGYQIHFEIDGPPLEIEFVYQSKADVAYTRS